MNEKEYFEMCKEAREAWKDEVEHSEYPKHIKRDEYENMRWEFVSGNYPALFDFWKGSDLDPESMVMEDVFGG